MTLHATTIGRHWGAYILSACAKLPVGQLALACCPAYSTGVTRKVTADGADLLHVSQTWGGTMQMQRSADDRK